MPMDLYIKVGNENRKNQLELVEQNKKNYNYFMVNRRGNNSDVYIKTKIDWAIKKLNLS